MCVHVFACVRTCVHVCVHVVASVHVCDCIIIVQVIEEHAKNMLSRVSSPMSLAEVSAKYPVKYEESMNTVLVQEVSQFSSLNNYSYCIHSTI